MKLADTFVFDEMPVWREILTSPEPERSKRLADPVCRAKLQAEWDDEKSRAARLVGTALYPFWTTVLSLCLFTNLVLTDA